MPFTLHERKECLRLGAKKLETRYLNTSTTVSGAVSGSRRRELCPQVGRRRSPAVPRAPVDRPDRCMVGQMLLRAVLCRVTNQGVMIS
jgi:hypothetical protein